MEKSLPSQKQYEEEANDLLYYLNDTCGMCIKFQRMSRYSQIAPCRWDYQLKNARTPKCNRYKQRKRDPWNKLDAVE